MTAPSPTGLRPTPAPAEAAAGPIRPARPAVYVHIGEPKTGTTYLQQVLWANRSELAVSGVMLPGPRPLAHWRAAQDLREVVQIDNDPIGPFAGAWDRLARQALRAPRVAVISHELLSAASEEQAARAVRSLGAAEVHVVLTVRDFATLLPAEWQETVKHRSRRGWEEWLGQVIDREAGYPQRRDWFFWRVHDTLEILRIWSRHVPRDRVHVITVPRRGADQGLLWTRFASLLAIDPARVDTTRARANASLGLAEVELLRRVNQVLPTDVPDWFYMGQVKELLAHGALAQRPRSGRLELPTERDHWAREQAEVVIDGLRQAGYDLLGDLDELRPRPVAGPRPRPADATTDDILAAAVDAISALLVDGAAARGIAAVPADPSTPSAPGVGPGPGAGPASRGLVKRALIAASRRSPTLHRLRRGYWHAVNTGRRMRQAAATSKVSH